MSSPRLALGTVAFGLPYGIRKDPRPSCHEVFTILSYALQEGIEWIDTAAAYGEAETILGEFHLPDTVKVSSKLPPFCFNDDSTGKAVKDRILSCLEATLSRLHRSSLTAYLLHTAPDIARLEVQDGFRLVQEDKTLPVSYWGVSCYTTEEADQTSQIGLAIMQAPYNAFDQRFQQYFPRFPSAIARSPFLQGLLTMDPATTAPQHANWVRQFRNIASRLNFSPAEAALTFALTTCSADWLLLGVHSLPQLKENLRILSLTREILHLAGQIPHVVQLPSLWVTK